MMWEEKISAATARIFEDYSVLSPRISVSDYLMIRRFALEEIRAGIHTSDDVREPSDEKPSLEYNAVMPDIRKKAEGRKEKRTDTAEKKDVAERTVKTDLFEKKEEKTNSGKSDYEILRSLTDEWN